MILIFTIIFPHFHGNYRRIIPFALAAIPNHSARLNIKRHLTNIHICLVSKAVRKTHKTIHVGKVRCQAN